MSGPEELRARILGLQRDRKPVPLEVEEWGDGVYMRVLTAAEQADLPEGTDPKDMPVRVILHCLVDAGGERIFADNDFEALEGFPFPEIMAVFAKVAKVNGLSSTELEEAVERFRTA